MKLIEIDLTKGSGHSHPEIERDRFYLAKYGGGLYFGKFSFQWYGLNFDCGFGGSGIQFDTPGSNSSDWQQLWLLVEE